jgi:hypothetical protein
MFSRFCVHELDSQAIAAKLSIHINREPIEANDELPSRVTRRSDHLQEAGGGNAANGAGQAGEAKQGEQAGGGALDLDEESGGAVLAEDTEELGGVSGDALGGSGETGDSGDLSDDGTDGALDVRQVEATEEAEDSRLNLNEDGVAAEVGDAHDVGESVTLHVASDAGSDTLEGTNQGSNERANLGEAETGEETLNGGGELDKSDGALAGSDSQETTGGTVQVQGTDGRSNLDDLANGLGDTAQVETGQEASHGRLKLYEDQLGSLVSHGQDAVHLASDLAGNLVSRDLGVANTSISAGSSAGRGKASRDARGNGETRGDDARGQAGGNAGGEDTRSSTGDDVGGESGDGGGQNGSSDGERLHLDCCRECGA